MPIRADPSFTKGYLSVFIICRSVSIVCRSVLLKYRSVFVDADQFY